MFLTRRINSMRNTSLKYHEIEKMIDEHLEKGDRDDISRYLDPNNNQNGYTFFYSLQKRGKPLTSIQKDILIQKLSRYHILDINGGRGLKIVRDTKDITGIPCKFKGDEAYSYSTRFSELHDLTKDTSRSIVSSNKLVTLFDLFKSTVTNHKNT